MDIDTSKGQAPSYPLSTTYYFSGKVEFDADGDGTPDVATEFFDTDGVDPEPPGAESDPLEKQFRHTAALARQTPVGAVYGENELAPGKP